MPGGTKPSTIRSDPSLSRIAVMDARKCAENTVN